MGRSFAFPPSLAPGAIGAGTVNLAAVAGIQDDPAKLVEAMGLVTHPYHMWGFNTNGATYPNLGTSGGAALTPHNAVAQQSTPTNLDLVCVQLAQAINSEVATAAAADVDFNGASSCWLLVFEATGWGNFWHICYNAQLEAYSTTGGITARALTTGGGSIDSESKTWSTPGSGTVVVMAIQRNVTANNFQLFTNHGNSTGQAVDSLFVTPPGNRLFASSGTFSNAIPMHLALMATWTGAGAEQDFASGVAALSSSLGV